MKRTLLACLLLALCGSVVAAPPPSSSDAAIQKQMAQLQTRMNELATRMAALSATIGNDASAHALRYLADSRRGMLGIAVEPAAHGWDVNAVTPGGPAARAGIKVGDTITAIDGDATHKTGADAAHAGLSDLTAGKPARLAVLRDGKTLHLDVTPERMQAADWQATVRAAERAADDASAAVDTPEFRQRIQQSVDTAMERAAAARLAESSARDRAATARQAAASARAAAERARASAHWALSAPPWWGLNLAPLNPDLGHYFGTDKGVLVLSQPDKQFQPLQAGDVITAVGGQAVARPEDVQRALRDRPAGKPVQLALRRQGKTLTVSMAAPRPWLVLPPPPPPPPPPMPPAPPAPPAAPPPPPSVPPPPPPPAHQG